MEEILPIQEGQKLVSDAGPKDEVQKFRDDFIRYYGVEG